MASVALYNAIVSAPGFALGVRCTAEEILAIEYLPAQPAQAADSPLAAEAVRQIRAYLSNPAAAFGLPLRPSGTTFQRRVWAEIESIPPGQVRTYGDVARRLHNAPRAVGQACGANPFPLVVPCHRVIASGGGLGGFAGQTGGFLIDVKRWLLQHENHLAG
jgi:methylated-DNA-[protein]-cysteine S-methyltransferase